MVYQTRGIVLHKFTHTDNKMIVKIYTELYGMNSYLYFRSSKSKTHTNLLMPMSLIDIVSEKKNKGNLDYIKDIKVLANLNVGGFDIAKSSICMFLNEILYKLFSEAGEDKTIFNFLFSSLSEFFTRQFIPDFHLRFLTALVRELGCCPENNFTSAKTVFSIEKSCFVYGLVEKKEEQNLGLHFHHLLEQDLFPDKQEKIIPYMWRNSLLEMIMNYYTFHVTNLSQIKSHEILKMVLHP
ncbi:MAG: DNA repair protein RecO [Bacteroidales bacterium]|nr:DNA repair protein RecO [Bacteroidales bacterium]